jgi:hypothetical protein
MEITMKQVTMYEANDGKLFTTETECWEYEHLTEDAQIASERLQNGATMLDALVRANLTRPYWDDGLTVRDKVALSKMTKDTAFVVRHWQCSEEPCYKPSGIEPNGNITLFGSPNGQHYGGELSVKDIVALQHT